MPSTEDYEATVTMLTGLLFMIAQLPNGTQAQQRAFAAQIEMFQWPSDLVESSEPPRQPIARTALRLIAERRSRRCRCESLRRHRHR